MSHGRSSIADRQGPGETKVKHPGRLLRELVRAGHSFSGHERNCCFVNLGGRPNGISFADVSGVSGFDLPDDARAVGLTDWNGDGFVDFWCLNRSSPQLRLFVNRAQTSSNRFLRIRLIGTHSSRDPIGARVTLELNPPGAADDPVYLVRTLRAGNGYLSQSSKWLHFGLGALAGTRTASKPIRSLVVDWPRGGRTVLNDIAPNQHLIITEGVEHAATWRPGNEGDLRRTVNHAKPARASASESRSHRTLLTYPMPITRPVESIVGTLDAGGETFRLVCLWASWCQPCISELSKLTAARAELESAGIQVVAQSVELEADAAAQDQIADSVGFEWRVATEAALDAFQWLHDQVFDLHTPLEIPVSFLVDVRQQAVVAVYKGEVSPTQVIADTRMSRDPLARREAGVSFRGRWDGQPARPRLLLNALDLLRREDLESCLDMVARYKQSLAVDTDYHVLLFNIGQAFTKRGQHRKAIRLYQSVLTLRPNLEPCLYNLGVSFATVGDHRAAVPLLRRAYMQNENATTAIALANSLARLGQTEDAIGVLATATESEPENAALAYEHAILLALRGSIAEAVDRYLQSVRWDERYADEAHQAKVIAALKWSESPRAGAAIQRIKRTTGVK